MAALGMRVVVLALSFLATWADAARGGSKRRRLTAEEQLIMDLFRGYDTDARSVINNTKTVTVKIQFLLLRIQKLDERSQIFITTGLVITDWNDERLIWDPKLYNNITDIVVKAERIWIPELAIINGADEMIQEFEKIRVLISHDGAVHWEPGGVFVTTCDIDITYFPFDRQSCPVEIGAWSYKSSRMNLTSTMNKIETGEFKLNGEWDIQDTRAEWKEVILPCCPDIRYSKVVFTIIMNRRYTFYVMNIILPCVLLSTLILIVFCVPPDAGEKISAGISVLLAFTVFLLMLADNVPRTSLNVPILVLYLGSTMALGTSSVCLSVVVLNFHHRSSHTPMPGWMRTLFVHNCARFLGVGDSCLRRSPSARPALMLPGDSPLQQQHKRLRARPNNYKVDECDSCEMLEMHQTILTPGDKRSRSPDALLADNLHTTYQRIDNPVGTGARGDTAVCRVSQEEAMAQSKEDIIKEWRMMARVLDRIFFLGVFIIMFSSAMFILLSPWYAGAEHI